MNDLTQRAIQIAHERMNAMPSKTAGAGLDQMKAKFQEILSKRGAQAALDAGLWGGGSGLITYGVSRALGKSRGRSLANAGIVGGATALGRAGVEYRNEIGDKLTQAKGAMENLMKRVRQNLPSSKGKGAAPAAQGAPAAATPAATPAAAPAAAPAKASSPAPAPAPTPVNEPKGAPSTHQEGFNAVNGAASAPVRGAETKKTSPEQARSNFDSFIKFWKDAYRNAGVKPDDGTSQSAAGIKKTKEALHGAAAGAAAAADKDQNNPANSGVLMRIRDAISRFDKGDISAEELQQVLDTYRIVNRQQ